MLIRSARAGLRIEEIQTNYRSRIGESKLVDVVRWLAASPLIFLACARPPPDRAGIDTADAGDGDADHILLAARRGRRLAPSYGSRSSSPALHWSWEPRHFWPVRSLLITLRLPARYRATFRIRRKAGISQAMRHRRRNHGDRRAGPQCGSIRHVACQQEPKALSHFGLASLSQSLVITGGTLASFGVISRFLRARAAREPSARRDDIDGRSSTRSVPLTFALNTALGEGLDQSVGSQMPQNQVEPSPAAPVTDLA